MDPEIVLFEKTCVMTNIFAIGEKLAIEKMF